MTDLQGATITSYRLEELLGVVSGVYVYRGIHRDLDQLAAVKVISPDLKVNPGFPERFFAEARRIADLRHANLVEIYEAGEYEDNFYFITEWLKDGSLRTLLQRRQNMGEDLPLWLQLNLIRQAAEGLSVAHKAGVIHGDVKPEHILLRRTGPVTTHSYRVKVTDFGLARLSEAGASSVNDAVIGAPAYMSPERGRGDAADARSDVYSLGVVLYELATGYPPFEARNPEEAADKHQHVTPTPPRRINPDVPPDLEEIILRTLEKQPADRFQSMDALGTAIDAVAANVPRPESAAPAQPPAGAPASATVPPLPAGAEAPLVPRDEALPVPAASAMPIRAQTEAPVPAPAQSPVETPNGSMAQAAGTDHLAAVSGELVVQADRPGDGDSLDAPRVHVYDQAGHLLQTAPLTSDGLSVGRAADNNVVLGESAVSSYHLRIDWDGRHVMVTDLGSSYGTLLAGRPLAAHVREAWQPGDWVHVMGYWLSLDAPVVATSEHAELALVAPDGRAVEGLLTPDRIRIDVKPARLNLIPGQVATLTVTVANQGEYVDHYHLTVEGAGINPSWVTGPDRPIQLNPGRESSIPLQVLVPREPGSLAREYPVTIRAVSEEDSSDSSAATAVWNIVRFSSTELTLVPRRATGWHRKVFLLTLGNGGNAPEEYAFSAVDDENKLRYDFLHGGQQRGNDTLPLAPGRAERVPLAVVAPWRLVGRTERILFTVTAKPADGPEQTVPAEFNQRTLFPVWSLVLMALALAGLALLIVYLRQPASPEIKSFTVAPPAVKSNTPVTIRWDVRKASSVSLQIASKGAEEVLVVKPKGHTTDVPLVPTKYTLIAENKGRPPVQDWRQVRIIPPQVGQPVISSFTVEPGAVDPGNPVTVRWNVHNAQLVKLQMASKDAQTIQVVPTAGRVVDRPQNTTKYTLIVSNQGQAPLKNWRIARIILPPTAVPAPPSNGSGSGSGSGSGAGSGSGTKKSSGAGAKKGGSSATKPKTAPKPQPTHHAAPAPVVHPTAKPAPKPTPAPRPKPTSAVLQAQNFLGTWNVTNTPPGPNTLSRLVITQPKPTSVSVHAFYSCAAGACDRGTGNGGLSASGQTRTLSAKIPVSGGYLSITATRVGHNLLHVFVTPHTTTCLGCARQSLYFLRQPVTQTSVATPAAP